MQHTKRIVSIGTAAACVLAGGAIGISQSAAAGKKSSTTTTSTTTDPSSHPYGYPGGRFGGTGPGFGGGFGDGGAVHSVSEELNKAGTAYIAVTTDSGTITAVDKTAGTITLKEGTNKVTYGTPTLTIPSGATVILNGSKSELSDLATGDHVTVSSSSDGTIVSATNSSFRGGWEGGARGPAN